MQVGISRFFKGWVSQALAVMALGICAACAAPGLNAQDQGWFRTGTGLGVAKARVAVADFAARTPQAQPLEKMFHDVLWADLDYSGVLELVSPSFYPTSVPSQPSELKAEQWSLPPGNAYMLAYGNLTLEGTNVSVAGYLSDVHNPTAPIPTRLFLI